MRKKRRNRYSAHKIMLVGIGVLSIVLMTVLIMKAYQFHQEKLQMEEWQVRHDEVQAELESVTMKIRELSEDGEALQMFLEEEVKPSSGDWENMPQSGDAILVSEPEPVQPQPPAEPEQPPVEPVNSISENSAEIMDFAETVSNNAIVIPEAEETVSTNSLPVPEEDETVSTNSLPVPEEDETVSTNSLPVPEEDETVSTNSLPVPEEDETVSTNSLPVPEEEETVSNNSLPPAEEEETVSNNTVPAVSEDDTVSQNNTMGEPQVSISGNAIVNGQVIPFEYEEAELTLEARRRIRSSYAETEQVNEKDKYIISSNSINFSDMKIACLGDSITSGSNMDNLDNYQQYSYPSVLKNILNAKEVYNLGIGGSSYGRYWDKAFVDRYKEIPQDVNIILVMGGTNDGFAASQKEMGSFAEKKPRTFYGDVDELMRGLKENYPMAKIVFATPLPNVLHDYLRNQRDYLLPQSAFAQAIKELAAQYDIDVIDLYNSNVLDTHDAQIISSYMPDGVHGNPAGYRVLAEHMASQLIQIMEKDRMAQATVSGNTAPDGVEVNGGGNGLPATVSQNTSGVLNLPGLKDGKWVDEQGMSREEKAKELKRAEDLSKKAAQGAMVVEPSAPVQDAGSSTGVETTQDAGIPQAGSVPSENIPDAEIPVNDYQYDGEAIVIQ